VTASKLDDSISYDPDQDEDGYYNDDPYFVHRHNPLAGSVIFKTPRYLDEEILDNMSED